MVRLSYLTLQIALSLIAANLVQADLVTQSFVGQVTAMNVGGQSGTPVGVPVNGISVGSTFAVSFTYDTATSPSDANPSASQGQYILPANANNVMSADFGAGRIFQKGPTNIFIVETWNNVVSQLSNNTDIFSLSGAATLPSGWSLSSGNSIIRSVFFDGSGTALSNDSLPTTVPTWPIGIFSQSFSGNVATPSGTFSQLYLEGSLVAIPEPGSSSLLAGSLVCWAARRRRNR